MVGKLFERPDRQRLDPDRHAPALLALIAFGIGQMILIDDPAAIGLPIRRAYQPPHGLESADMHLGFLRDHAWVLLQVKVDAVRSEEHTTELQSLMRISYAVFCLKTKN